MVTVGEVNEELEHTDSANKATPQDGVLLPLGGSLNTVGGGGDVTGDDELGVSPAGGNDIEIRRKRVKQLQRSEAQLSKQPEGSGATDHSPLSSDHGFSTVRGH